MPSEQRDPPGATDRCRECGLALPPDANFCPDCGAPRRGGDRVPESDANARDAASDAAARQTFRVRVRDHLDAGWEVDDDYGDRVVLVKRDIGSIPVHLLLLLTTSGVGNLLYGWYNYVAEADTRRLAVGERPPPTELSAPGTHEDPLVTISGYLLAGVLVAVGVAVAVVAAEQGSPPGALFGAAFAAVGVAMSPPAERRFARRHRVTRFGRLRSVDRRITPSTERTEAPCVACGGEFERGVVRRRRDETVVAGVPIRTHSVRYNHYCADCARAELFDGDPSRRGSNAFDPAALDLRFDETDAESKRERESETER